ncbi:hypothetical protein HOG17_00945 [Candidatus Peregrinibacteria bacterium]|jgi:hypothetical protein|nr:hypothetical protein [Candidatus Peregrinibacteria bacterium]MBT4148580.1 hypothetical protein [Candidatus Peregrinibacteria bacterium]MBT4366736.1 hypothetical protein [Candidatus Peregrinibacteria bacterium]MBT4456357.1 hypothetical protein [Candidatus Peregrinibacteria bacterium]
MTDDPKNNKVFGPETREAREGLDPEIAATLDNAQFGAEEAMDGRVPEDEMLGSLADFIADLETERNLTSIEKVRKIRRLLLYVSRFVEVDPEKIKLVKLPGNEVGEAGETTIKIDPVLFDNNALTADNMVMVRHALLHELFHMEKDIDNEGLVELASSRAALDKIQDYHSEVNRVAHVVGFIGAHFHSGDRNAALTEVLDLYTARKYDGEGGLYPKFVEAYHASAEGQEALAKNPDAAEKVWHLAFPELKFDDGGQWVEDEELCEDVEEEVDEERAARPAGSVDGGDAVEEAPTEGSEDGTED